MQILNWRRPLTLLGMISSLSLTFWLAACGSSGGDKKLVGENGSSSPIQRALNACAEKIGSGGESAVQIRPIAICVATAAEGSELKYSWKPFWTNYRARKSEQKATIATSMKLKLPSDLSPDQQKNIPVRIQKICGEKIKPIWARAGLGFDLKVENWETTSKADTPVKPSPTTAPRTPAEESSQVKDEPTPSTAKGPASPADAPQAGNQTQPDKKTESTHADFVLELENKSKNSSFPTLVMKIWPDQGVFYSSGTKEIHEKCNALDSKSEKQKCYEAELLAINEPFCQSLTKLSGHLVGLSEVSDSSRCEGQIDDLKLGESGGSDDLDRLGMGPEDKNPMTLAVPKPKERMKTFPLSLMIGRIDKPELLDMGSSPAPGTTASADQMMAEAGGFAIDVPSELAEEIAGKPAGDAWDQAEQAENNAKAKNSTLKLTDTNFFKFARVYAADIKQVLKPICGSVSPKADSPLKGRAHQPKGTSPKAENDSKKEKPLSAKPGASTLKKK